MEEENIMISDFIEIEIDNHIYHINVFNSFLNDMFED